MVISVERTTKRGVLWKQDGYRFIVEPVMERR